MSTNIIKFDVKGLDETAQKLAGIQNGFSAVLKTSLFQARTRLGNRAAKIIDETYDITKENLRMESAVKMKANFTPGVGAWAYIGFAGPNIPLSRFRGAHPLHPTIDTTRRKVRIIRHGQERLAFPSVPSEGHALKSTSPTQFRHVFTARMKSGHVGLFERVNRESPDPKVRAQSLPITQLTSASIAHMVSTSGRKEMLEKEAVDYFHKRIDANAESLLKGHTYVSRYGLKRSKK